MSVTPQKPDPDDRERHPFTYLRDALVAARDRAELARDDVEAAEIMASEVEEVLMCLLEHLADAGGRGSYSTFSEVPSPPPEQEIQHLAGQCDTLLRENERLRATVARAVIRAVARERERCAKIAEHLNGWGNPPAPMLAAHIAKVIRSAGVKVAGDGQCRAERVNK